MFQDRRLNVKVMAYQESFNVKWRNSAVFFSIKLKQKLKYMAYLWLCYYDKQDSVLFSVSKIVRDRIRGHFGWL